MVKGPPVKWNDSKHAIKSHDKTQNDQKCCCRTRTQGCSYKHSQPQIKSIRETYYDHLWYQDGLLILVVPIYVFWRVHEWEISPKGGERFNKVGIHRSTSAHTHTHTYTCICIFLLTIHCSIYLFYLFMFLSLKNTHDVYFVNSACIWCISILSMYIYIYIIYI